MKAMLKKIGEYFSVCLAVLFAGYLAGWLTLFVLHSLIPSFPMEAVTPPANDLADWRSLMVIAIGCLAMLCFFFIRSLVSQPLGKLIEKGFTKWDAVVARGGSVVEWIGRFILSKPTPKEAQAAQSWAALDRDFGDKVINRDYKVSYEADQHAITMQKKSLLVSTSKKGRQNTTLFYRNTYLLFPGCLSSFWPKRRGRLRRSRKHRQTRSRRLQRIRSLVRESSFTAVVVEYHLGLLGGWLSALGD
jgi:hypothetical protein